MADVVRFDGGDRGSDRGGRGRGDGVGRQAARRRVRAGSVERHSYRRPAPGGPRAPIDTFQFRGPLDVVARAEVDATMGWRSWPEVWHLDDSGRFCCYFKACTGDGVGEWAADPTDLYRSRDAGLADGGCTDRWLIVESRPLWLCPDPVVTVDDGDSFVAVRSALEDVSVVLLDAMVFDDQGHWWSLNELASGSLKWP